MTEPVSAPQPGSAEFRLDLELASQAVRQLEGVGRRLVELKRQAHELSRQASTEQSAHDLVSLEAFRLLALKADGGSGSLGLALDGGITQVQTLIHQMKADIAQQQAIDEQSRAGIDVL